MELLDGLPIQKQYCIGCLFLDGRQHIIQHVLNQPIWHGNYDNFLKQKPILPMLKYLLESLIFKNLLLKATIKIL